MSKVKKMNKVVVIWKNNKYIDNRINNLKNGPSNESNFWYINSTLYQVEGPVIEISDGKLHREDGRKSWFVNGNFQREER